MSFLVFALPGLPPRQGAFLDLVAVRIERLHTVVFTIQENFLANRVTKRGKPTMLFDAIFAIPNDTEFFA